MVPSGPPSGWVSLCPAGDAAVPGCTRIDTAREKEAEKGDFQIKPVALLRFFASMGETVPSQEGANQEMLHVHFVFGNKAQSVPEWGQPPSP